MKFSIITAVYNNKNYIKTAIESVSSQTHPEIEYIVIDGKSTDGTYEILKEYENKRIIDFLLSETDTGIYDALNKGIKLATGDVIGFLHSDDLYPSADTIEKVNKVFNENTSVDAVYGNLKYVSKDNPQHVLRNWQSKVYHPNLLRKGWMPPHPTFFVLRKHYLNYGMFDTSFKIAADYELMLRFLGKYKIAPIYLPETLVIMRMGGASNNSISNIYKKSHEDFIAIKRYNTGNFITLLRKNLSKLGQFFT